jgi:hypothetical protein
MNSLVAFFRQTGFLSIPQITTDEELELLRAEYDSLFESQAGREVGRLSDLAGPDEEDDGAVAALPQLLDPQVYAPAMRNTLYEANALACAKQLIGPAAEYMLSHAISKPAWAGVATPWHQDERLTPPPPLTTAELAASTSSTPGCRCKTRRSTAAACSSYPGRTSSNPHCLGTITSTMIRGFTRPRAG